MHRFAALVLSIVLCGCGLSSPIIKSQAIFYDDVIEDTTNKLLLLNILRARDKAPLHFAHIPLIHESMQQSASLSVTAPFGWVRNSTLRNTGTAGVSVQMAPSFDVVHLNSKEFVTGIASPIDPKFVKYWLDRGLDRRIVLLLFFSSAEIVETMDSGRSHTIRITNSPGEALDVIKQQGMADVQPAMRCDALSDFQRYLKLINSLTTFYARAYTERRLLAENINLDPTKDIKELQGFASLDPSKVQWTKKDKSYTLYSISAEPKIALCFYDLNAVSSLIEAGASGQSDHKGCYQSVVETSSNDSTLVQRSESPIFYKKPFDMTRPSEFCAQFNRFFAMGEHSASEKRTKMELRLQIRSVGEMIQFLGDLLEYQDALERYSRERPKMSLRLNTPVTFGYCPEVAAEERAGSGCNDVFFNLRRDSCNARFTVSYRNNLYSVANHSAPADSSEQDASCRPGYAAKDHTLEVLSVVNQLVDLRKSATDIRATPYVQVLP